MGAAQKFLEERPIPLQSGPVSPRPACARCLPALSGLGGPRAHQMALASQFPAAFPGPDSDQTEVERETHRSVGRSV